LNDEVETTGAGFELPVVPPPPPPPPPHAPNNTIAVVANMYLKKFFISNFFVEIEDEYL
jgi:hypothetical protein